MLYGIRPVMKPRIWGSLHPAGFPGPVGEIWWVFHDREGSTELLSADGGSTTVAELVERGVLPGSPEYPVLLKTLHTADRLSVQVHPGGVGGHLFKEETWIVLAAEEGAWMMGGILPVEREVFLAAVEEGRAEALMRIEELRTGDAWHIPPGTVHALGPGLTVLEVQSNCDVTYRLYDWGRTDVSGGPRELHLEEAADSVDWSRPVLPVRLGRDRQLDGGLLDASYSIVPVEGNASVLLTGGGILFMAEGGLILGEAMEAPACVMADSGGGELRIHGRGYLIEP
ncbi:MAG: hypothetical protein AVO35_03480 [Candidatus Aegiribacteria sp. MLS_C]|nr:MAG: hypothetical protein AVO35_03480 [Candidatus Aegiribacteria sp. MLS_C]